MYFNKISSLEKYKSMIKGRVKTVISEKYEDIDINNLSDFEDCEYLIKKNIKKNKHYFKSF